MKSNKAVSVYVVMVVLSLIACVADITAFALAISVVNIATIIVVFGPLVH